MTLFWLTRILQIIALATRPGAEHRQLTAEIVSLRKQLATLSLKDDYTTYIKTERKIKAAQTARDQLGSGKMSRSLVIKYGSQALLTLTLVGISITYRYVPVIVLGDQFNFTPFGWLMTFPTGISGAVSVPFWIFVNSFVSKGVASAVGQ